MDDTRALRQRLTDLFQSQRLGVLSTHSAGQPYGSLIAFSATGDLKKFYFATPNTTRKFSNLKADPRVSILVNSSNNADADFHEAIAVTMVGDAAEIASSDQSAGMADFLGKHPYLEDFVRSPTTAFVEVSVRSYYMVQNFQKVTEYHLTV